jgi:pimeloyl-ACP methyl ester carboxylesterase
MLRDYEQLKRSFYVFYFQSVLSSDMDIWNDGLSFLKRLWQDWSPGYDAEADLHFLAQALHEPLRLTAAINYYRSGVESDNTTHAGGCLPLGRPLLLPTLYLHGDTDGCVLPSITRHAEEQLPAGSRFQLIEGAGHFLHLERPGVVNDLIVDWVRR